VNGAAKEPGEPRCTIAVALNFAASTLRSRVGKALLAIEGLIVVVVDAASADVTITDRMLEVDAPAIFIGHRRDIAGALQEGFVGGLLASFSDAQLRIALEAALHGMVCAPAAGAGSAIMPLARVQTGHQNQGVRDLTAREADVLEHLMTGASNKQIARELLISVHTVKFHVASIIAKFGASSRTDAVARAIVGREMI
jgi:DNA-binding NarL/FixJ family response regulator